MRNNLRMLAPITAIVLGSFVAVGPATAQVRIGGFTDFIFYATDDESATSRSGYKEGQFVLHLNAPLSDRVNFFAEVTWTPSSTGFGTEIERSIATYRYNDALKPAVGRFHTPASWWNAAFHHGSWLQTTIDRPIPVKFGSKFTSIHFVGAMVDGTVFPGGFSLSYTGGVGNGRGDNIARAGDAGDNDSHRATLFRVALRHDHLYALQIGGSAYLDQIPAAVDVLADERMLSAFVVYSSETPELLAEFFHVVHDDPGTGEESDNTGYYAQLGFRLPWRENIAKAYGRIEGIDVDEDDRAFQNNVADLRRGLAGLRIDLTNSLALKLEGRRFREGQGEYINEFYTSVGLVF